MKKDIKILAIESSCDETAAAIICVKNNQPIILSSIVSSQVDLHAKTGGVVPEVASRAHMEAIIPVITQALLQSGKKSKELGENSADSKLQTPNYADAIEILQKHITHIAVTAGPGLIGSLLVGFNAAKAIAYSLNKPIIPVNHIEGHIYSAFSKEYHPYTPPKLGGEGGGISFNFPILSLTVSGGHTSFTLIKDHGLYENIGQTLDDAAGEAFDKVAKLLDLGYPGGPIISKLASQFRNSIQQSNISNQNNNLTTENGQLKFPRPIINDGTFNFSFSGLKTAVLTLVKKLEKQGPISEKQKQEIAAAFEDAAVDVLVTKAMRAVEKFEPKTVVLAGGVAANKHLRETLSKTLNSKFKGLELKIPDIKLCGDNAAMIGIAAYYHIQKNNISSWNDIKVDSNMELV